VELSRATLRERAELAALYAFLTMTVFRCQKDWLGAPKQAKQAVQGR
jgi:hypothetical protein